MRGGSKEGERRWRREVKRRGEGQRERLSERGSRIGDQVVVEGEEKGIKSGGRRKGEGDRVRIGGGGEEGRRK